MKKLDFSKKGFLFKLFKTKKGNILSFGFGFLSCGCLFLILGVSLFVIFMGVGKDTNSNQSSLSSSGSINLPAGWSQVIEDAAQKINVPPAMIAAIYLTEHHITKFSGDINPNGSDPNCKTSYAGATGPFQLMPDWWKGSDAPLVKNAQGWGLVVKYNNSVPYVDVCEWRAAAIGGAYAIKAKMNAANIKKDADDLLSDAEVKEIAKGYCGCCDCPGCGSSNFDYCEFALERYKELIK